MKPLVVGVTGLAAGLGLQCYMFRLLPELYRIKWLCDLEETKIQRGVAEYGGAGTRDFDDLLRDPEVDLVTIATPVATHASLTRKALAAGKHVLLEKPITATVAEADELIALSKKSAGILCIAHQRRFMANQKVAQDAVNSGDLGHVLSVRLDLPIMGVRGSDQPSDPATWTRRFMITHGYDYIVHHVDQVCRLLNEKPRQVFGRYAMLSGNDLPCEIEIAMMMPSGVLASVNTRYSHAPDPKWQIDGEKGTLRMESANDMGRCFLYQHQPDGSTRVREIQPPYMKEAVDPATGEWRPKRDCEIRGYSDQDPHLDFYQHLYAAIAGREPVPASPEDARDAIKVIWLAIESARTGRVMNWS